MHAPVIIRARDASRSLFSAYHHPPPFPPSFSSPQATSYTVFSSSDMAYVFKRGEQLFPIAYSHAEADCSYLLFQMGESRHDASTSHFTDLYAYPRRKERVQFDKVRVVARVPPRASLMDTADYRADSQALLRLGQGSCRPYWVSRYLISR